MSLSATRTRKDNLTNSQRKIEPEDLRPYRKWGMTLLQLMALLITVGLVGTLVLHYFFY
jgi:hypothetical protein